MLQNNEIETSKTHGSGGVEETREQGTNNLDVRLGALQNARQKASGKEERGLEPRIIEFGSNSQIWSKVSLSKSVY